MRTGILLGILTLIFLISANYAFAGFNEELEDMNTYLLPEGVQQSMKDQNSLAVRICKIVPVPFLCPAKTTQNLTLPETKNVEVSIKIVSEQEQLTITPGVVQATSSAQVLGIFSGIGDLITSLFSNEETAYPYEYKSNSFKGDIFDQGQIQGTISAQVLAVNESEMYHDFMVRANLPQALQPDPTSTFTPTPTVTPTPTGYSLPSGFPTVPPGGSGPFTCSPARGQSCSFDNLKQYFPDELSAKQAAIICNMESGGDPSYPTITCPTGGKDYSIGLFQVNMLAHCTSSLLYKYSGYRGGYFNEKDVFEILYGRCVIKNQNLLTQCVNAMKNAGSNIQFAVDLYKSNGWIDWRNASNICGIVKGQPIPTSIPLTPTSVPGVGVARVIEMINGTNGIVNMCRIGSNLGIVRNSNARDCLSLVNPALRQMTYDILLTSAQTFYNLQCVGLARAAVQEATGDEFASSAGNAVGFATFVPQGWYWIPASQGINPRVGDVPLWSIWKDEDDNYIIGPNGHIAYVVEVLGSNTVRLAEGNWGAPGKVQLRNWQLSPQMGYIGLLRRQ